MNQLVVKGMQRHDLDLAPSQNLENKATASESTVQGGRSDKTEIDKLSSHRFVETNQQQIGDCAPTPLVLQIGDRSSVAWRSDLLLEPQANRLAGKGALDRDGMKMLGVGDRSSSSWLAGE